jgi:protein HOOK3
MEELVRAKEERETMLKDANAQIATLTATVRDLEGEVSATNKKVVSLSEEVNTHLTSINSQNSQIRNAEAEAAGVQAKLAAEQQSKKESVNAVKEEMEGQKVAYEETVTKLSAVIKAREASIEKVTSDKNKIEQYTKQTLHKFQDKYLIALQDCKQKLKDERAKNDALEARMNKDKAAQKREERLLSSSLYELGLVIMKQQIKN